MTCQIQACEDPSEIYCDKIVIARKHYECGECRKPINPGDRYEFAEGRQEGDWWKFRTCLSCAEIRKALFCSWLCGSMWDDLENENVFTVSLAGLSPENVHRVEEFWKRRQS